MNNLNFDINNYTNKQLYELIGVNYNTNIAEIREKIIKFQDASVKIPDNKRHQYNNFMNELSKRLLNNSSINENSLIDRSIKHKVNAIVDGNELSTGIINPLNKTYLTKIINIDTRFRDNYYNSKSSDFVFNLPTNLGKVVSIKLVGLEMQTSFYTFSEDKKNNFFWITLTANSTEYTKLIIIPDGNYIASELASFINNTLNTLGFPYNNTQFFYDSTINGTGSQRMIYGLKNGVTQVTNVKLNFLKDIDGNDDNGFPIIFKSGWIMGFRNSTYSNSSSIISEGLYRISATPSYVFLCIDDFNNNVLCNFTNVYNDSVYSNNIIARISVGSIVPPYNTVNINSAVTNERLYMGPVEIKKFKIQLVDEYGNIVNMNNMDFSFSLQVKCLYDL